ncbi:hypothetical protein E2F46_05860 [Luteimonas aestuarii]|uniref:DUF2178 domain-containing protein n=1 Tax=Luteimonas aestuarii TaxID=453837 RepID=A0A4R5TY90_9GAMM|nr:hypothetical protein [Luteimonas aestuarii]TDK26121.1 hypothetical protein E2F46_05860 [Luteimonas aestuarii]
MSGMRDAIAPGFGERFALNSTWGLAGLGAFCAIAVVKQGSLFSFIAVLLVLFLSHWFRRRAMHDQQRRNEAMEDERDSAIASRGDRAFRVTASIGIVALALALAIPAMRGPLLEVALRLPGVLLLALIAANLVGHVVVAHAYVRERR